MSAGTIKHKSRGLARSCNAWDLIEVTGGVQCSNCLEHNVVPMQDRCPATCWDGEPCPLPIERNGLCWVHDLQARDTRLQEG
jgi:hypothetical protein